MTTEIKEQLEVTQTAAGSQTISEGWKTITDTAGRLRDRAGVINSDVSEMHHTAAERSLDTSGAWAAKSSVQEMLTTLGNQHGMSWSTVADLIGVTPAAVRKWRKGGDATGDKRAALGRLVAFLDMIAEAGVITDPANYLEMPLKAGYTVTGFDIYKAGKMTCLLDFVGQHTKTVDAMLDEFDPDWRTKYETKFEVVDGGDGSLAIRAK